MSALTIYTAFETRSATRGRAFWLNAFAYAALSATSAFGGLAAARYVGHMAFGPATAGIINLNLLIVPLLALVAGALSLARERERGTLAYLTSLPLTLREVVAGKFVGLLAGLSATILAGFGAAFLVLALLGVRGGIGETVQFAGETWLLAVAMGAIGLAISVCVDRTPLALGLAVLAWLGFVAFADLGVMATALVTHLGAGTLVAATLLNPVEAYKIAAVAALSGSVDVLGPGGRLATDLFGGMLMPAATASLALWLGAALGVASFLGGRRDAI
jgi:Cu-processing system permease protein